MIRLSKSIIRNEEIEAVSDVLRKEFLGMGEEVKNFENNLSTYLENRNLATIVMCTKNNIDSWFFLEYLLSDINEEFRMNETYL